MSQDREPGRLIDRRFIGLCCMLLSLVLCLGVGTYTYLTSGNSSAKPGVASLLKPAATQPPITCKTPAHPLGNNTLSIPSAGLQRTFIVHLPPTYGRQPQPMVVAYHGYSWQALTMARNTTLFSEADQAGFVLVVPQGVDTPPSWNAGVGAYGPTGDANDIQFTSDLLNYVQKNFCVDSHRVYATGFSLGGGMAYRVACALTNRIAAVATVSGAYYPLPEGCHPSRPLPVLEIHGQADRDAPYTGYPALRMAAVQDYLDGWLARDQCTGQPQVFFQKGDVTGMQWTHCAAGTMVRHYRISDNGHTWPGTPNTTHVIDGGVVVWQFFQNFSLPH